MEYLGTDKPINKIQPVVSVCIQTYQHKEFIAECLNSVLIQETDFPFEIIVGEDESTDGTREICKQYAELHPDKIRLFLRDEKDKIYIDGRKTGRYNIIENLKAACGKYIALCDGDDYWTNHLKLQKQIDFLEANENYSLVFCNGNVVYTGRNSIGHPIYRPHSNTHGEYPAFKPPAGSTSLTEISSGNYIHTAGVVFSNWCKTTEIPKYFYQVSILDWPLHLFTALHGKIKYFPELLFSYRIHDEGAISKKNGFELQKILLFQYVPIINSGFFEDDILSNIRQKWHKTLKSALTSAASRDEYEIIKNSVGHYEISHSINTEILITALIEDAYESKVKIARLKANVLVRLVIRLKKAINSLK